VHPDVDPPKYLPEEAVAWARRHLELLERVVEDLLETGRWPEVNVLSRRLAREGAPIDVRSLGAQMPKLLGFLQPNPERIVLLLFGLRMTHTGQKLLGGFAAMLRLAVERYAGDDNPPAITRADAARGTVNDDPYVTALSEIVLREAPFLGSGSGGPEEGWTREVTSDVTRYWHAVNAEDYLRIRAEELMRSPQFGRPPTAVIEPQHDQSAGYPSDDGDDAERRDVFISHAGEDKAAVARPLALELRKLGYSVWLDEDELVVGDSLSESIDWGLAHSDTGVVVLSRTFFEKPWPRRELRGLVAREMASERTVILPVWHGIDLSFLVEKAPTLADPVAANTADGIPAAAAEIAEALCRRARPAKDAPAQRDDDAAARSASEQHREASTLRGELVELLRAGDHIGTQELLRAERRAFDRGLAQRLAAVGDELDDRVDHDRLRTLESFVWGHVQRRLATLLPLVQYAPDQVVDEVRTLAVAADRTPPTRSRMPVWRESMHWPVWMVVYTTGALAVAVRQWDSVAALWQVETRDGRPLAALPLGNADRLASEAARSRPNVFISSRAVWMWHLAFRCAGSSLLDEHYPELLSGRTDDPVGALLSRLGDFSWLVTALAGRAGIAVDQYWQAGQVHPTLPGVFTAGGPLVATAARVLFNADERTIGSDVQKWIDRAQGRTNWA
jgi:hypothetical protein